MGEENLTYFQLWQWITNLNECLKKLGISKNQRVLIACNQPLHFIISVLSVISMGSCAVFIDRSKRLHEIEGIREKTDGTYIITDRMDLKADAKAYFISFERFADSTNAGRKYFDYHLDDEAEGCIIYTSGSLSVPKGVIRRVGAILGHAKALADAHKFDSSDCMLFLSDFHHAYGFEHVMAAIYKGATIYAFEEFQYHKILSLISEQQANVIIGVPFHYEMLNKIGQKIIDNKLRLLVSAGAPLSEKTNKRIYELFQVPVTQLYGSSETAATTTNTDIDKNMNFKTVGSTIDNVEIKIVNESKQDVGKNITGDILIKSPYCSRGYIEETKGEYGVWYETGDIGYIDEEEQLYITGRKKTMINFAGKKVSPEEVEMVIREYGNIKAVKVQGVLDEKLGETIKATIITEDGQKIDEQSLLVYCSGLLAEYKLPRILEYTDSFILTSSGKLKR